jgi:hypothetical protein
LFATLRPAIGLSQSIVALTREGRNLGFIAILGQT